MTITQKHSPNFTPGRGSKKIDLIVIHHMNGTIESADATFQNTVRDTSAHYGIARDGRVWQWVQEKDTAYHAGVFSVNQRSIGIEHEDLAADNYTDTTYETSSQLIADICKRYGIVPSPTTIQPHRNFKPTACPGTLDIARLIDLVKKKLNTGDMDKTAFVKYIYRATQGREPSASELSFALGLSENDLVKLRFRDDVIGGYWKASAGTDCPESEKDFWQNEIIVNPAHDIVFLQKQWHTDHAAQPAPLTPEQKKQITKDYVESL